MPELETTLARSRFVQLLADCWALLVTAAETSVVVALLHSTRDTLGQTAGDVLRLTRLRGAVGALFRWCRHSTAYGWLVSEPDTMVIDLRHTWTVGPVIAVLDGLVSLLRQSRTVSTGAALARRLRSNPARMLSAALVFGVLGNLLRLLPNGVSLSVSLVAQVLLLCLALVGTQAPASTVRRSVVYRLLAAVLAPPDDEPEYR